MLTHPHTDEQRSILAAARGPTNLMISALAGTGKTYALEQIQSVAPQRPILYLVFNRKNADEARTKMLSTTKVKTFNGIGHDCWFATGRTPRLNPKKVQDIYRELIAESPRATKDVLWSVYDQVVSGVGLAKSLGYIPPGLAKSEASLLTRTAFHQALEERPDDLVSDLLDAVLSRSIALAYKGLIDYNDQAYMPALFGGTYPKFPLVMVDEFQDLSPVNHVLLAKLVANRRIIGVGDPNQSIYGFRGAQQGGMAQAVAAYGMEPLSLSVSFRCPEAIVRHVRWRVPNFKWSKAGGLVNTSGRINASTIDGSSTFICRNNAPLMATAFKLLAGGHSVSVAGSDVGPRLIATMRRLGPETLTQGQALSAIDNWEAERLDRESPTARDMADCMRIFARHGDSLGTALAYAEHLFAQKGTIQLLTGHKAKGLEFSDVYHLDPWLCKDSEQDRNLSYVISTRSEDRLTEVDSGGIDWSR